ncbi:MAG: acetyltransferase [Bacteroidales bacterium]|nr:acetyltransferase [Bacteroidales bacterium]
MIIIGAKGFAKEVLQIFYQKNETENLHFFDNINIFSTDKLYGKFRIIQEVEDVIKIFEFDNRFVLGIGNPTNRFQLSEKFKRLGGELNSIISPYANIGAYGNTIMSGTNIMTGAVITNDILIEEGVLINLNCTIGHDSIIEKYSELCPGVHISGNVKIGAFSFVGTGAVILPDIKIGKNVIIGAGAVVTKDVQDNALMVGSPAKKIKELPKINV